MHATRIAASLILVAAAGALAFRLPQLARRPMHTDEANHTVKAGILLDTGRYTYDPKDFHGPTHYYAALPLIRLGGAHTFPETTETMYRLVPVLFGVALVLLVLGLTDGLGPAAAVCAAAFTALSPAMVFYSRYYIQEMLLVAFTFAAIVAGWRYSQSPKLRWALVAGAAIGLMHATKETCILALGSMVGAVFLTRRWSRWRDGPDAATPAISGRPTHLVAAVILAALVSATLLSAFFTNPRGPLDAVLTYFSYIGRAAADPSRSDGAAFHHHPWHIS